MELGNEGNWEVEAVTLDRIDGQSKARIAKAREKHQKQPGV